MLPNMSNEELRSVIPALWTSMTTGKFAALFDADERAVRAYTLTAWDTDAQPGEQRVTLSTPRISVDLATHLLTQHPPVITFHAPKGRESNAKTELAQRQEDFCLGVFRRNELERGDAVVEAIAFSLALYNRAIVRSLYLDKKQRGESFPFWLQPLNPRTVVYQAAGANIDWVLVHDPQKPLMDIVSVFGPGAAEDLGKTLPKDLTTKVPWYEY